MSEEQDFNIHDAMGFISEEPAQIEEINDNEEELEEHEEVQQADEEESDEPAEEEVIEEEEKPKQKGAKGRITELAKQKKELASENELLKRELASIRAEIQPLKNMAAGLDALGVNKQPQQAVDIDAQLQQFNINPDDYDSDGEKRLALRTAQLETQQRLQQVEQGFATIEEHVYNSIVARDTAKADLGAINLLIEDRAIEIQEDYGLSKTDAQIHAKRAILKEAANKAQATGQDITDVLLKKGKSLATRRNINLSSDKKSVNINNKAREEVSKRAGKPNIDTIAIQSKESNPSDDFMSKMGFVGW